MRREVRGARPEAEQKVQVKVKVKRQDCWRFEARDLRGEVKAKVEGQNVCGLRFDA